MNIDKNPVVSTEQRLTQTFQRTATVHPDEEDGYESGYESMIDPVLRTKYEDLTEDDEGRRNHIILD